MKKLKEKICLILSVAMIISMLTPVNIFASEKFWNNYYNGDVGIDLPGDHIAGQDQKVGFTITPISGTTTKVGEKLSFTVQLGTDLSKPVNTAGVTLKLPETLKTTSDKKTSKWTISALDKGDPIQPSIANFDFAKLLGAATYEYNVAVQKGDIFKFEVEGVKPGKGTITLNFTFKTMDGEEVQFASGSGSIEVTVACAEHEADTEKWYTDGTYHWRQCKNCGAVIEETKAAHTGGTATCQVLAQCDVCEDFYGSYAPHQYTVEQHDNDNHWYKCANCEATTTPEPHEGQGSYVDKDNDHHYQNCSCGVEIESEHVYDNACDDTCDLCGHTRTVPGHNWTEKVEIDYLKTEKKCNAYAVYYKSCSECGVSSKGITDETFENVEGGYADHHVDTETWWVSPDEHWHACDVCGMYKEDVAPHDYQNIILWDRSNEVKGQPGVFYKVCSVCYHEGTETFNEVKYDITEGANAKFSGKGDLVLKSNMQNFQGVVVDDVVVEAAEHEFTESGLVLTLPEAFLKTLAKGDHKVVVYGWDGQAETTISVVDAQPENPGSGSATSTGDSANVMVWLSVFVLSVVALAFTLIVSKKKSN